MFNYPFYTSPSYYTTGMGSELLGGGAASAGAGGLLKGIAGKWSWNGFLTSTGKTLNVINQAIPIFYQVRPIVNNAKTMFRVLGAVKGNPGEERKTAVAASQSDHTNTNQPSNINRTMSQRSENLNSRGEGNPTFFL